MLITLTTDFGKPRSSVSQVPEPPSPHYRNRVPNLSPTYRRHRVKHVPEQHIANFAKATFDLATSGCLSTHVEDAEGR
jgi:hypothetical protein